MLPSQKTSRPSGRTVGPSGKPRSEASSRASIAPILQSRDPPDAPNRIACKAKPLQDSARSAYDRGPPDGRSSMASGPEPAAAAPQDDRDSSSGLTRRRLLERAAAAGIVLGSSGVLGAGEAWAAQAAKPKRGGTLRIGMVGGGQSETLDPN